MWLILQYVPSEDFVITTGVQHTVREFATLAFKYAGIELRWEGEGINERGIETLINEDFNANIKVKVSNKILSVSKDFYRPTNAVNLWSDPTKAKNELGWNPSTTSFEQLVKIMVNSDMAKVAVDRASEKVKMNPAEYLEKELSSNSFPF